MTSCCSGSSTPLSVATVRGTFAATFHAAFFSHSVAPPVFWIACASESIMQNFTSDAATLPSSPGVHMRSTSPLTNPTQMPVGTDSSRLMPPASAASTYSRKNDENIAVPPASRTAAPPHHWAISFGTRFAASADMASIFRMSSVYRFIAAIWRRMARASRELPAAALPSRTSAASFDALSTIFTPLASFAARSSFAAALACFTASFAGRPARQGVSVTLRSVKNPLAPSAALTPCEARIMLMPNFSVATGRRNHAFSATPRDIAPRNDDGSASG